MSIDQQFLPKDHPHARVATVKTIEHSSLRRHMSGHVKPIKISKISTVDHRKTHKFIGSFVKRLAFEESFALTADNARRREGDSSGR